MTQLVKITIDKTALWVETDRATAGAAPARVSRDSVAEQTLDAADALQGTIKALCTSLVEGFRAIDPKPKKVAAEFGLKLSGDSKFYVVNVAGEASLKITAEWQLD